MADNFDDLNESTEELIEMFTDLERQGKLTRRDLEKLAASSTKVDKAFEETGKAAMSSAAGFKNFALQVGGGSTEISTMTTIVSTVGDAMAGLLDAIPMVGGALSAVAKAATDTAVLAIERLQVSFDSFQELSKAGLIGAEGISGLRDQMIETQIPMEKFRTILNDSAKDLTFFSGSALNGSQSLAKVMGRMQSGQDMQLRRLGFSIEEIGETVVDFRKTNQLMGFKTQLSTEEVTKSTIEYGKELDMVAKLTGQQRKEIQANRERLLADTRFSAYMNKVTTSANEDQVKSMMDFIGYVDKLAPTMGEGIKDLWASGGVATTEAGKRIIQQGMGPAVTRIQKEMLAGTMNQGQAQRALFEEALKNKNKFRDLSAIVGDFGAGIPFEEMLKLAKAAKLSDKEIEDLTKSQKKQSSGTDELTDSLIGTTKNLQAAQTNLDALATAGNVAAGAVNFLSDGLKELSGFIKKELLGMSEEEIAAQEAKQHEKEFQIWQRKALTATTEKEKLEAQKQMGISRRKAGIGTKVLEEYDEYGEGREFDQRYGEILRSRNWVDWGIDNPALKKALSGAGYEDSMNKAQADLTKQILDRYSETTGYLPESGTDDYTKMQSELSGLYGKGGGQRAETLQMLKREIAKTQGFVDTAGSDGWSPSEKEERARQVQALEKLVNLLEKQNGLTSEQVQRAREQTQILKQTQL